MRIALSIWNDRISPVFDNSSRLLLIDLENGREIGRTEEPVGRAMIPDRAVRLKELGINVLLCGAISRPLAYLLVASGVSIIPFLTGEIEEVLDAYLKGKLTGPHFLMPGCRGGRRRFRGRRGF